MKGLHQRLPELPWEKGADQVNDCQYLFLERISEIEELTLELRITEAKPQTPITSPRGETLADTLLIGSRPIEPDRTCRSFGIIFDSKTMVLYSVVNELYGRYPEAPETFTGRLFRVFSKSYLLDYTKLSTYASDEYPGNLQHYQIACQNHVVDVICTAPPRIWVELPAK